MTSRRDFTIAAGGLGLGAALSAAARLGNPASPGLAAAPDADSSAATATGAAPATADVNWMDVKAAGARGDGSTDDTAALQRVFERRTGGVVYFPPGAYVISRTIRVPNPVSIVGDGGRATYLLSRITDSGPVLDIGLPDYSRRLRGARLAGFTIRGEGDGRHRSGGLRLHAFYDAIIASVRIESLGWGLECDRAISVQFDNLVVNGMSDDGGASGEGVYLYGQSNGCLFNTLRSADHAGAALRLGDGQNLTLASPVMESTRSTAIVVGRKQDGTFINCRGVTILNPYFEKNRPYDMQFLRGTPPTIIGGYWGPTHNDYVAPIRYQMPFTAIGCAFPPAPGGAVRVERDDASALFIGCSFGGDVATYRSRSHAATARLRLLGADGDRVVGGDAD